MKRYMLFAGWNYYPNGGWLDFGGSFETVEEAIQEAALLAINWWHVVDKQTDGIVKTDKG